MRALVPHRSGAIRSPRCRAGSTRPSPGCGERERRGAVPPRSRASRHVVVSRYPLPGEDVPVEPSAPLPPESPGSPRIVRHPASPHSPDDPELFRRQLDERLEAGEAIAPALGSAVLRDAASFHSFLTAPHDPTASGPSGGPTVMGDVLMVRCHVSTIMELRIDHVPDLAGDTWALGHSRVMCRRAVARRSPLPRPLSRTACHASPQHSRAVFANAGGHGQTPTCRR